MPQLRFGFLTAAIIGAVTLTGMCAVAQGKYRQDVGTLTHSPGNEGGS